MQMRPLLYMAARPCTHGSKSGAFAAGATIKLYMAARPCTHGSVACAPPLAGPVPLYMAARPCTHGSVAGSRDGTPRRRPIHGRKAMYPWKLLRMRPGLVAAPAYTWTTVHVPMEAWRQRRCCLVAWILYMDDSPCTHGSDLRLGTADMHAAALYMDDSPCTHGSQGLRDRFGGS